MISCLMWEGLDDIVGVLFRGFRWDGGGGSWLGGGMGVLLRADHVCWYDLYSLRFGSGGLGIGDYFFWMGLPGLGLVRVCRFLNI